MQKMQMRSRRLSSTYDHLVQCLRHPDLAESGASSLPFLFSFCPSYPSALDLFFHSLTSSTDYLYPSSPLHVFLAGSREMGRFLVVGFSQLHPYAQLFTCPPSHYIPLVHWFPLRGGFYQGDGYWLLVLCREKEALMKFNTSMVSVGSA